MRNAAGFLGMVEKYRAKYIAVMHGVVEIFSSSGPDLAIFNVFEHLYCSSPHFRQITIVRKGVDNTAGYILDIFLHTRVPR